MFIKSAINAQNSEIDETFEPNDLKLGVIVGGRKCLTRKLIHLIDILLKPFLKHIKSVICDSLHFVNKCPRKVDEDTEIVTFDVVNLYARILHEFGHKAIDYFLSKYEEDLHSRFRNEFILESVNLILKSNTSTFDSKFYLQIKGTAMGTIFTLTYASLTMEYHGIKVCCMIRQRYALASKYFENFWFGYLADCQVLLKCNFIKPVHLLSILKQINKNIQFAMEKSQARPPFLDIMMNKIGTKI